MAEVFGDPNRQYGIPGIDDQAPGSAAQQAGVQAYRDTYDHSGDTTQASVAAVHAAASAGSGNLLTQYEAAHGTNSPNSAPAAIVQAGWLAGGAIDANWMVFNGVPGYQSTDPRIRYGMTAAEKAALGATYWSGSSLSPSLQALVEQARGGTQAAARAASQLLASVGNNQVAPATAATALGSILANWAQGNPVPAAIAGLLGLKLFKVI